MSVKWTATVVLGFAITLAVARAQQPQAQAQQPRPQAQALKTEKDVRSYALGMDLGNQLRKIGIEVDPAVFAKGLGDALAGGKVLLSDADAKAAIARLQADAKAKQMLPPADPKKIK